MRIGFGINASFKKNLVCVYSIMFCSSIFGQNDTWLGSWNNLGVNYKLTEKLSIGSEAQLRSRFFYNNFFYYEFRGVVKYSFNNWFAISSGLSNHNVYKDSGDFIKPATLKEIRLFEDIFFTMSISRFKFESKNRFEQRFTNNGFKSRFRPRLQILVSLNKRNLVSRTVFLSFSDEVFISDKFEKVYNSVGLGYKLDNIIITSGLVYENNFITKIDNKYLLIGLILNLN